MSGKYFIDTNIFAYTFDHREKVKRDRSLALIAEALRDGKGTISFQVVQEFLNLATKKFTRPLKPKDCSDYLDQVLAPLCRVFPSFELCREALEVQERWQFSFYDSLIVAAALSAGCEVLYSEDFQAGQRIRELQVVSPFGASGR